MQHVDSRTVRTFKRRSGRVTTTQAGAIADLWPHLGLVVDGRPLDVTGLFGREAPLVLEIGFGMGEATAELAATEPDRDIIAVDVHTPGQGNLLKLIEAAGLTNVRVASGDARVLLAHMLAPASLTAVRVFFPDPWPKARHAKRRLVTRPFTDLVADRLVDGGLLHVATDIEEYADGVRAALGGHPSLAVTEPPWRPTTKFEQRAVAAGRRCRDIAAVRRARTQSG